MCPPQKLILETLDYDPETGIFVYRPRINDPIWNKRFADKRAGNVRKDGYVYVTIWGKLYAAHRVAWVYVYGTIPEYRSSFQCLVIDHINGVKSDNRIYNLDLVPSSVNAKRYHERRRELSGEVYYT